MMPVPRRFAWVGAAPEPRRLPLAMFAQSDVAFEDPPAVGIEIAGIANQESRLARVGDQDSVGADPSQVIFGVERQGGRAAIRLDLPGNRKHASRGAQDPLDDRHELPASELFL